MLVKGEFKFLGVEKRSGFKDPSQTFFICGFAQGLDSLRCYVNPEDYGVYSTIEPYTDVVATLDYNPVSGKVALLGID